MVLWSAESVSSAFGGGGGGDHHHAHAHAVGSSASAASGASPSDGQLLRVEHEESCYAAAWSCADPWVWASASYDGRVLVQQVPRSVRYRVAL